MRIRDGGAHLDHSAPRQLNRATMRRVGESFQPYKSQVAWTLIMVVGSVALGLMPPWFLRIIVDQGLTKGRLDVTAKYSIYTIVVTVAASLFTFGYGYLSVDVGQRIMRDYRNRLFNHLQGMSLRFFTSNRTGEIQSRLMSDVSGVQSVVSDVISNALSNIGVVVASLIAMIALDWRLTLMSVGLIPLFAWISSRAGGYARKIRKRTQEQTADLNSLMQETLSVSGILLTKTSGRRSLIESKFSTENQTLTDWQVKVQMIQYFFFGLIRMIFSITPALVYWLAGYLTSRGGSPITLGTLVAFTALQSRMFFPLSALLSVQVEINSSFALFDRIFEYLDTPQEITDSQGAIELEPDQVSGDVRFEDVGFRYDPTGKDTLRHINFEAKAGQLIALVGPSGAGKTTLTYLLARLYDVDTGRVLIDGHDVRDVKLSSLEGLIGAVTQETYLVHATVRENLRYAQPDASDEQIVAAAKAAAIHDHIASLPEGYGTVVGERGYKLSGGEKQRIAIARAILKNPRILILDEATSALDTTSERLIQNSLNGLMKGRTTFAIAHRLSTILSADLILVIKDGEIAEAGKHADLLANESVYASLYNQQFGIEPEEELLLEAVAPS